MEWLARQTVRAQTVAKLRRRAGSRPDLADCVEWWNVITSSRLGAFSSSLVRWRRMSWPDCQTSRSG